MAPVMRYRVWKKGELWVSEYFDSEEFECQCSYPDCIEQRIAEELIDKLEGCRREVGKPVVVTSGFRCDKHQADLSNTPGIKTVAKSTHPLGHAADIKCRLMTPLRAAVESRFKAIGVARTFLHVDLRDDKKRRWTY
jgi:uncharacterized protein YcbK (DUF882 family)